MDMAIADPRVYLADLVGVMKTHWPANRTVNIVCHGHSVPSGYFATPMVDTFNSYPHLLHVALKQRFPFGVINVIVEAIGGEGSPAGAARFEEQVLCHRPDVVTIDYSLNDRGTGLPGARAAWQQMIDLASRHKTRLILLTPTPDNTQQIGADPAARDTLRAHARQVRELADLNNTGLVDSLKQFERQVAAGTPLENLMSWQNHPNRAGHDLVAAELLRYFPADI